MKQARCGCTRATQSRSNDNRRRTASGWAKHHEVPEHALPATWKGRRVDSSAWVARIEQEETQPPKRERFSSPGSYSSKDSFLWHHPAACAVHTLNYFRGKI